jgi:hypothetical protein
MNDMRFNRPVHEMVAEKGDKRGLLKSKFKKFLKTLIIVVIIAVIILLVSFGKDIWGKIFKPEQTQVYSAVFLTNGQVYFGKIEKNNEREIALNNVFYVQVNQNAAQNGQVANLNQASFNLVKLGNELHGPTDELFINRAQVVFYENLRDDSKVVESIKNYKK